MAPLVQGIKWTATKWIHTKPFRPENLGEVRHGWGIGRPQAACLLKLHCCSAIWTYGGGYGCTCFCYMLERLGMLMEGHNIFRVRDAATRGTGVSRGVY